MTRWVILAPQPCIHSATGCGDTSCAAARIAGLQRRPGHARRGGGRPSSPRPPPRCRARPWPAQAGPDTLARSIRSASLGSPGGPRPWRGVVAAASDPSARPAWPCQALPLQASCARRRCSPRCPRCRCALNRHDRNNLGLPRAAARVGAGWGRALGRASLKFEGGLPFYGLTTEWPRPRPRCRPVPVKPARAGGGRQGQNAAPPAAPRRLASPRTGSPKSGPTAREAQRLLSLPSATLFPSHSSTAER